MATSAAFHILSLSCVSCALASSGSIAQMVQPEHEDVCIIQQRPCEVAIDDTARQIDDVYRLPTDSCESVAMLTAVRWKLNVQTKTKTNGNGSMPAFSVDDAEAVVTPASEIAKAGAALLSNGDSILDTTGLAHIMLSADVVAVVNNFNHKQNLDWLRGKPSVNSPRVIETGVDVKSSPSHNIAESWPWIGWIVTNYDTLPEFVAFLHGDQRSWHSTIHLHELTTMQPQDVHMLSHLCWTMRNSIGQIGPLLGGSEAYFVESLYKSFWNMSFAEAWHEWQMERQAHCCSESLVSRTAIQRVPKDVYVSLDKLMHNKTDAPWGYIMERVWQKLFSKKMVFESRVVRDNIEKLHTAPQQHVEIHLDCCAECH